MSKGTAAKTREIVIANIRLDFTATMKAISRILSGLPERVDASMIDLDMPNAIQVANDHLDDIAKIIMLTIMEVTRLKARLEGAQQLADMTVCGDKPRRRKRQK